MEKSNKIKVGDRISFTNKLGYKVIKQVSRVEEKSWYDERGMRNSYGTLESYKKENFFKIS